MAAWNAAVDGRQLNEMRPGLLEGPAHAAAADAAAAVAAAAVGGGGGGAVQDAPAREHRSRYTYRCVRIDVYCIDVYMQLCTYVQPHNAFTFCIKWLHGLH